MGFCFFLTIPNLLKIKTEIVLGYIKLKFGLRKPSISSFKVSRITALLSFLCTEAP